MDPSKRSADALGEAAHPAQDGADAIPFPSLHSQSIGDMDDELRAHWLTYGQRYDLQTGLLNIRSFQELLEPMLRGARANGESVALIWLDVLNLRKEFSLWGWSAADALVRHVGGSMRVALDEGALITRFSRCFVAAARIPAGEPSPRRRVQQIVDLVAKPVAGFAMAPEIAAGVSFFPTDADNADDLARFASLAAEAATEGRLRYVLPFHPGMSSRLLRDHEVGVQLDRALENGQLRMFYQPKVNLVTGDTLGAEALIRWNHPEWGEVPPDEFIPLTERSGLIDRVFEFGLRTALADVQRWRDAGIAPPIVAVNVSPANLRREDFVRHVRTIMSEIPIAPVQLELEVTESLLLDDEKLFTARLRQLKTIGVRVAIDDFGTRYTGFDLLKQLPVDTMKIDRCFIRGIHRSRDLKALCETIIVMARHMHMRTVAEGIEEREELEALQEIGCEAGQGFLLQRPIPAAELADFLTAWPSRKSSLGFVPSGDFEDIDPLYGITR